MVNLALLTAVARIAAAIRLTRLPQPTMLEKRRHNRRRRCIGNPPMVQSLRQRRWRRQRKRSRFLCTASCKPNWVKRWAKKLVPLPLQLRRQQRSYESLGSVLAQRRSPIMYSKLPSNDK